MLTLGTSYGFAWKVFSPLMAGEQPEKGKLSIRRVKKGRCTWKRPRPGLLTAVQG